MTKHRDSVLMEGLAHLVRAVSIEPANPLFLFMLGRAYFLTHQYNEAVSAFEKSLQYGGDVENHLELAKAYRRRGDDDAALAAVARYIEKCPGNSAGFELQAELFSAKSKFREAKSIYEHLIKNGHDNSNIRLKLGYLCLKLYEFTDALTHLSVSRNDPTYWAEAGYYSAAVYAKMKRWDEAHDMLTDIINRSPHPAAQISLSIIDWHNGRVTEIPIEASEVANRPQLEAALIIQKAHLLLLKGDYKHARQYYQSVIDNKFYPHDIHCALSISMMKDGDAQGALHILSDNNFPPAFAGPISYCRGRACEEMGRGEDAMRHYRSAIEFDDSLPDPYVRLGILYSKHACNYTQAYALFVEARQLGANSDAFLFYYGLCAFMLNNIDECYYSWSTLHFRYPGDTELFRNLQCVLYKIASRELLRGDYAAAIKLLRQYERLPSLNANLAALLSEALFRWAKSTLLGHNQGSLIDVRSALQDAYRQSPGNSEYREWLFASEILATSEPERYKELLTALNKNFSNNPQPALRFMVSRRLCAEQQPDLAAGFLLPLIDHQNRSIAQKARMMLAKLFLSIERAQDAVTLLMDFNKIFAAEGYAGECLFKSQRLLGKALHSLLGGDKAKTRIQEISLQCDVSLPAAIAEIEALNKNWDRANAAIKSFCTDFPDIAEAPEFLTRCLLYRAYLYMTQSDWENARHHLASANDSFATDTDENGKRDRSIIDHFIKKTDQRYFICQLISSYKSDNIDETLRCLESVHPDQSFDGLFLHASAITRHDYAIRIESSKAGVERADRFWQAALAEWASVWADDSFWSNFSDHAYSLDATLTPEMIDKIREELPHNLFKINEEYIAEYASKGDFKRANDHFNFIIESTFPADVKNAFLEKITEPYRLRAQELEKRAQFDAAIDTLEKWLLIDPDHLEIKTEFANLCIRMAREYEVKGDASKNFDCYSTAEGYLDKLLAFDPMNRFAHQGKAVMKHKRDEVLMNFIFKTIISG